MKFPSVALALVLLAASAFAADVDGKWTGAMNTRMGDVPVSFTFKADGANLTGSTTWSRWERDEDLRREGRREQYLLLSESRLRRDAVHNELQGRRIERPDQIHTGHVRDAAGDTRQKNT